MNPPVQPPKFLQTPFKCEHCGRIFTLIEVFGKMGIEMKSPAELHVEECAASLDHDPTR